MAISHVRPLKRCRIASRNFDHARKLAEEMRQDFSFPLEPVETVEEAIKGSDLIVTATTALEPIVKREWISGGAHLNLVGSSRPNGREVDSETMAAASFFVDRRESTLNESGDYLFAAREGVIGPDLDRRFLTQAAVSEAVSNSVTRGTSPETSTWPSISRVGPRSSTISRPSASRSARLGGAGAARPRGRARSPRRRPGVGRRG